ncbi:TRAP transporter large permease [Natronospirillum operosum]|uniref:TRAP transporter large permease protein n=1 Tax=Natronospirillum operosum TaxID=2759953 RepID=A0A4Z0WA52_9GAMM|nr:TRAP transporter large permease [Natronospirillum operosum]TGG95032.1 TRAP transporter large permease [Natronospirillum operosum]
MTSVFLLLGSFLALISLRVPIAFAIGVASLITVINLGLPPTSVVNQMLSNINSFALLAVPFFLLLGRLMNDSGITDRLMDFAQSVVGHIRGGLGHINVLVSMMFASMSGSAAADTASVGAIMIPAMTKAGYPAPFAVALTATSSTLGVIVPPSILFIIYGAFGNISISALFLAGILPGILVGLVQMGYTYHVASRYRVTNPKKVNFRGRVRAGKTAAPVLLIPIIILGGITSGFFTATEAASVAALTGLILAVVVYRTIKLNQLFGIFSSTVVAYSLPMFAVAAAGIMGWLIAYLGVAREVADLIISISDHSIAIMFMVMLFCVVIGTVLSPMTAVIIFLPIIQELTAVAGISDIHMALVVCLSLAVGLTTPPYGICLLIAAQIGNVSMPRAFLAVLPIIGLTLLVIASVVLLPDVFLFLPQSFFPQSFPVSG